MTTSNGSIMQTGVSAADESKGLYAAWAAGGMANASRLMLVPLAAVDFRTCFGECGRPSQTEGIEQ